MKIYSLIHEHNRLIPTEVELSFQPGLPQIQFLGLPDQGIRESIHRIKSAIRSQGFEFPKAQQILVNLRPSYLKKSSRGLELAVAAGILWETGQLKKPDMGEALVYGELSLSGEVFEPEDLVADFEGFRDLVVYTGQGSSKNVDFARCAFRQLRELESPEFIPAVAKDFVIARPELGLDYYFPRRQAEILRLVALGEHSVLLAGPSGSGKSTIAKTLASLLKSPTSEQMNVIVRNQREFKDEVPTWRPIVHPHHSTSPLGLIGGGAPPFKGEIARAHQGLLILDELLEFHPRAQEALREPMEEFRIRIRRGRYIEEQETDALVIATTNLCPCGDRVPQTRVMCGRSLKKCQSYAERLSGPLVDRFQIAFFTRKREDGEKILGSEILQEVEAARDFHEKLAQSDPRFEKVSSKWTWDELIADLPPFYLEQLFPKEISSRRRELATLRVARSIADLKQEVKLQPGHIEEALKFTYTPFEALKRLS